MFEPADMQDNAGIYNYFGYERQSQLPVVILADSTNSDDVRPTQHTRCNSSYQRGLIRATVPTNEALFVQQFLPTRPYSFVFS